MTVVTLPCLLELTKESKEDDFELDVRITEPSIEDLQVVKGGWSVGTTCWSCKDTCDCHTHEWHCTITEQRC